jgi:hypothetical protein
VPPYQNPHIRPFIITGIHANITIQHISDVITNNSSNFELFLCCIVQIPLFPTLLKFRNIHNKDWKKIGRHCRKATQRRVYQQTIKNLERENLDENFQILVWRLLRKITKVIISLTLLYMNLFPSLKVVKVGKNRSMGWTKSPKRIHAWHDLYFTLPLSLSSCYSFQCWYYVVPLVMRKFAWPITCAQVSYCSERPSQHKP